MKLPINPRAAAPLDIMVKLWKFLKVRKKFWLLPIIFVMLLLGILLVFAQGSMIAPVPFIFTIF